MTPPRPMSLIRSVVLSLAAGAVVAVAAAAGLATWASDTPTRESARNKATVASPWDTHFLTNRLPDDPNPGPRFERLAALAGAPRAPALWDASDGPPEFSVLEVLRVAPHVGLLSEDLNAAVRYSRPGDRGLGYEPHRLYSIRAGWPFHALGGHATQVGGSPPVLHGLVDLPKALRAAGPAAPTAFNGFIPAANVVDRRWPIVPIPLGLAADAAFYGLFVWFALWGRHALTRRRRRARNQCPSCGYHRTGLAPDAACPECGTNPGPATAV